MPVLRVSSVIGYKSDPEIADRLHELSHRGVVEYLVIGDKDLARHRLLVSTDRGTECAIALPRSIRLSNGAVLELSNERAIVVELSELPWLAVEPSDLSTALEVGFLAGHHHWRVQFQGSLMRIAIEGSEKDYRNRLKPYLDRNSLQIVDDD